MIRRNFARLRAAGTAVPALVLAVLYGAAAAQESPPPAPDAPADRVFLGTIYTARDDRPVVEAVAVRGGRIVETGDSVDVLQQRGPLTEVIELDRDAALFPGFTDAHAHLLGIGQRELTLNLEGVDSIEALKAAVRAEAERTQAGGVIFGRGWIETHWPEKRFPTRHDLDDAAPGHAVILVRADGHALAANSLALQRAGITAETPDPAGGRIERDETGAATGVLIDAAMKPVMALVQAPTAAEKIKAYVKAGRLYAERGWTGVHNMSVDPEDISVMEDLAGAGMLPLRVYNSIDRAGADDLLRSGPRSGAGGRIVTRAVKLYMDGALGSRGAALFEPYADKPDTKGLILMERKKTLPLLKEALEEGIQVNTHAIGPRANRLVLDWYAEAFAAVPPDEREIAGPRWRIEHAQIIHPTDIPRFAELDVIASMQPSHAIGDLHFAPARLGEERLKGAYAWKSLVENGAVVAGGSDAPVEAGSPLIEFYAAVARKDLKGFSGAGWHPEEALERQTALKLFTAWAAYAAFQEDELGTIEPGKAADFTVFSKDIMKVPAEEIPKARAIMTVIGGDVVYKE
ncbi:MAG: amidohydrolase [Alphaproteobacteria bacterium]